MDRCERDGGVDERDAPDNMFSLILACGDIAAGEWMLLNDRAAQAEQRADDVHEERAHTRRPFPAGAMVARLAIAFALLLFVVAMMSMSHIARDGRAGLAIIRSYDAMLGSLRHEAPAPQPRRVPNDAAGQDYAGGKS